MLTESAALVAVHVLRPLVVLAVDVGRVSEHLTVARLAQRQTSTSGTALGVRRAGSQFFRSGANAGRVGSLTWTDGHAPNVDSEYKQYTSLFKSNK